MTRPGTPHRLTPRARQVEARLGATGRALQGTAVELALAAPFLSPRELDRWRARVTAWQRVALQDAALLGRLDAILARYTTARDPAPAVSA
jgi:hypothetical protein